MPDAEIIAVGTEMLTSQRIDTNSLYIADHLNSLGVEVRRKLVVGDDLGLLTDTVKHAIDHADVTVLTGGLGPTEDDLTRNAVAVAMGRVLVFEQSIADGIEARFRFRGRVMPEINKRQAYLIEGAEMLANTNGTAPGQWLEQDGRIVLLLPGPPSEMKPMFEQHCLPRFEARLPRQVIRTRTYRVTGLTESDLDQMISPVYASYTNPVTTILAHQGDLQILLRARCQGLEEAEGLLAEVGNPIEKLLGEKIYSRNGDALEAVIGSLLAARGATASVAESITGGMVGERITSVPGSSDYFVGGFLVYTDRMKQELLGVPESLLKEHSAVSAEVAQAMAIGARNRTGSTFAIATTGEAGPQSSSGATLGTVFVGIAGPDGLVDARKFQMPGGRDRVRGFATMAALDYLRRRLLQLG